MSPPPSASFIACTVGTVALIKRAQRRPHSQLVKKNKNKTLVRCTCVGLRWELIENCKGRETCLEVAHDCAHPVTSCYKEAGINDWCAC